MYIQRKKYRQLRNAGQLVHELSARRHSSLYSVQCVHVHVMVHVCPSLSLSSLPSLSPYLHLLTSSLPPPFLLTSHTCSTSFPPSLTLPPHFPHSLLHLLISSLCCSTSFPVPCSTTSFSSSVIVFAKHWRRIKAQRYIRKLKVAVVVVRRYDIRLYNNYQNVSWCVLIRFAPVLQVHHWIHESSQAKVSWECLCKWRVFQA